MDQQPNFMPDYAASLVDWWSVAGVDYDVGESHVNWLKPEVITEAVIEAKSVAALDSSIKAHTSLQVTHDIDKNAWPKTLEALIAELSSGASLPGNSYGGKTAVPVGRQNPQMMIICDLPDADEIDAGQLTGGASGLLLANIVKAIGYKIDDCYITALATTRPAIGELPQGDEAKLAAFTLHQIGLVQPKQILILGSAACQALLGADLMSARGNLGNINHDGQKVSAIATFHPRTLLTQPNMKAGAWKDLQMLIKKGNL
jgi:uracil-DNA glycosylase